MEIIKIKDMSKDFDKKKALNKINLTINKGEIFGLIGPNGAGKTTLISVLTTILIPSHGTALIKNFDITHESSEVRKNIGVAFQEFYLDEELTVFDNLYVHSLLLIPNSKLRMARINECLNIMDLTNEKKTKAKNLSGGMKKRLEVARALLSEPEILFLDEPSLGLDPIAKRELWGYIKKINFEKTTTIILATNSIEEAEELCSRLALIDEGKIIKVDTIKNLTDGKKLEDIFIGIKKNL